jgi:1-acyl-sn-glycerol-3-phosphate acyltransferase
MAGQPLRAAPPPDSEAVLRGLLEIARELALELHPDRGRTLHVGPGSALDRDLGLDSLGRAELLLRLERRFNLQLPEALLAEAEKLEDLLAALEGAHGAVRPTAGGARAARAAGEAVAVPLAAATLTEVLDWHADATPDRVHVFLEDGDGERPLTYGALRDRALTVAGALAAQGLAPGQPVAIMLPTGADFFAAFFGILYAGGVAVPIYPPARLAQLEEHLRRQAKILGNAGAVRLIAPPEARRLGHWLRAQVPSLLGVETMDQLAQPAGDAAPFPAAKAADVALLQYTSGSTGDPKGVVLTHANLLANIRAMCEALAATPADVFVSWLPLYHDMGLIGAWLGSLYQGVPGVIMSPIRFLTRPASWLWAIHRHRATLTVAPNFAYELCLGKLADADLAGLDLSSLRVAANGAEPVDPDTLRRFAARFAPYGFAPTAMAPVYGLAECAVGLAFPPLGREPIIDRVERRALEEDGEAKPAPEAAAPQAALEFVACGRALPGHEIRIVDDAGHELGERRQGRLQFRGPSATRGYFRNPEATAALFDGDWLNSGDLGYMVGGDIFLTGRSKDIIIRAGRNIYPHELEQAVGEIAGIRKGCVAVFGAPDPASGTERLVVLAETRDRDPATHEKLRQQIQDVATALLGAPADAVVLAPPQAVPKTSSGKVRRAASRTLFLEGRIGQGAGALRWQIARLALGSARPLLRQGARLALEYLYAGYFWTLVAGLTTAAWLAVATLPSQDLRWRAARAVARLFFRLAGTPLIVADETRLPAGGGVIVANHSSYIDGIALLAALPRLPLFVAKKELTAQFIPRVLLARLGSLFVERFDAQRGVEDIAQAVAAARAGGLVTFFPEGTLLRRPGLLPFRLGAFQVAAAAGVPLSPLALRGTRDVLRADQWFPRRGKIEVCVTPAIPPPAGDSFANVVALRDQARRQMLAEIREPDLGAERLDYAAVVGGAASAD